jgi:NADH-quinone oxidoreductase subunit E
MGTCGDGPVALVNNVRLCAKLTPEEADRILAGLE